MQNRIIVIDDERDFLESIRRGLLSSGFTNVRLEHDPWRAANLFERGATFDIAMIDINMPGLSGIELLERIKESTPDTECIMVTALNEAKVAVECLKKGAYDYLVKPISRDDLVLSIKRALEKRRLAEVVDLMKKDTLPELVNPEPFKPIITRSSNMIRILKEAELHAASDVPILITGESGTGKELLAKAIHLASPRAKSTFTPINMASLPGNLFDAEFFGHTKGAFTGAEKERIGYIEHTAPGTVFLDEIGDLPLEFQGKLLRVLQEGEFIKLGTNKPQKVDIRFIAATNRNLDRLISEGKFRKDLYYRLRGAWLHLPPLRERMEDLPLLIHTFLKELSGRLEPPPVEPGAMAKLLQYDYPGNVRELRSILQSAYNLAPNKEAPITLNRLPSFLQGKTPAEPRNRLETGSSFRPLAQVERDYIVKVYDFLGKNKSQTASLLGIGLNTLRRKLESYGVD